MYLDFRYIRYIKLIKLKLLKPLSNYTCNEVRPNGTSLIYIYTSSLHKPYCNLFLR